MTVSAKALRLLAEKRVSPAGIAACFEVIGDSGDIYRVIVGDGWVQCPCAAHREMCSHAEASALLNTALVERESVTV